MSKCFIISFDLKNPGLNREKLINLIKTVAWARINANTFLIASTNDSVAIRDILLSTLFEGDKIYVGQLDRYSAWYGFGKDISDWIKNNQK